MNDIQTFEATVRGQLLVAGGNGFNLTHPALPEALARQLSIIMAAHHAEIVRVLRIVQAEIVNERTNVKLEPYEAHEINGGDPNPTRTTTTQEHRALWT